VKKAFMTQMGGREGGENHHGTGGGGGPKTLSAQLEKIEFGLSFRNERSTFTCC